MEEQTCKALKMFTHQTDSKRERTRETNNHINSKSDIDLMKEKTLELLNDISKLSIELSDIPSIVDLSPCLHPKSDQVMTNRSTPCDSKKHNRCMKKRNRMMTEDTNRTPSLEPVVKPKKIPSTTLSTTNKG